MKKFRKLFAATSLVSVLFAPLLAGAVTQAATTHVPVVCASSNQINLDVAQDVPQVCDLSVDKQVSVNGGAFVEADTSAAAAVAQLGDTVTWKVTVTNTSTAGLTPHGAVYVKDVLPAGTDFQSYTATDGVYHANDGTFFENSWYLPLLKSSGDSFVTTLPATLLITTKASSTGFKQNTAAFWKYDPGSCDGGCAYFDGDSTNNSDDAWVVTQTKPKVLAASTTLVNTGSNSTPNLIVGSLILAMLAVVTFAGRPNRPKHYKV